MDTVKQIEMKEKVRKEHLRRTRNGLKPSSAAEIYYLYFQMNIFRNGMNPIISPAIS